MTLSLTGRDIPMDAAGEGWFQIDVPGVKHGDEYMLRLADGTRIRTRRRARNAMMLTALRWSSTPGVFSRLTLAGKDVRGKKP